MIAACQRVVPVCIRADYRIGLEQALDVTWVHVHVHRWSAAVARQIARDGNIIMALHGGPIYATSHEPHGGDDNKLAKFLKHFGFEYLDTIHAGGSDHPIYIRRR